MRRAALNKSKNRSLDIPPPVANSTSPIADSSVNVVEALRWDEAFQSDHHQFVNTVAIDDDTHDIETYSQPHSSQSQYNNITFSTPDQSYAVPEPVIDSPMTDALPAEVNAISAITATTTACFAVGTSDSTSFTTSGFIHQNNYSQYTSNAYAHVYNSESEPLEPDSNSESDLDQDQNQEEGDDIDLDSEVSVHAPQSDDPWTSPTHFDLLSDYIPHYHNLGYDPEMSDSEGGAPLNDDTFSEPQHQTNDQHSLPQENNDGTDPVTTPFNYISQTFLSLPTGADTIIMDAVPPPAPWVIMPGDNTAELPQAQTPEPASPIGLPFISNPNPAMFGSENLGLVDFLRHWAYHARFASSSLAPRLNAPCPEDIRRQAQETPREIRYDDLLGDRCDMQGLDWDSMNTTRRYARQRRDDTFKNYVNKEGSDRWSPHMVDVDIPSSDSFMRFKRYIVRQDVYLAHFQLRSVLACPSTSQAYYPRGEGVNRINLASGQTEVALHNNHMTGLGTLISTLDANHGAMFAGTFNGEYYLKSLDSNDKKDYSEGTITEHMGGITNHVQIYKPRQSSGPIAAISSNDHGFRLMDLNTQKFVMQSRYRFPLNCSRISPDGRLRVMVGDDFKVLITDAITGEIQQELSGHRDYGFSCDWSDDGWTVATGFQDKCVKIWDARRWCDSRGVSTPLCTIRSEMAGVRNLRFSPVGSGERVLVAAEEADYINIINAQTFGKKQTVDIFGEIGGVAFTNDGQDLNVLVSDRDRGGLLQLERSGLGPEPYFHNSWRRYHDHATDQWRYRSDEFSHLGEPCQRRQISTDALPIF
ncbi:hypothetical protein HYE67_009234 [Fusarium culmorum]|uniref:Uncharacterized protein n=1 Tax=Fusarium culmorum TaxID=5516 RepID=A0A2T4H6P5_FUSCU|nr:hypothetical protein FCULG_00003951 [Fusarium culmorum]QPC67003.1 hypothetical protein HYE67_009234 [Fusarium culmorum]